MSRIINIMDARSVPDLRTLSYVNFGDHDITTEEVRHILTLCDAMWMHSGDMKHPHAELASGKCSDGFFDVLRALRYTNLCRLFAHQLARKADAFIATYSGTRPEWVIGSDHAGAALSHSVAEFMNAQHDFTQKDPTDGKRQRWQRFVINPSETVLNVEELVTTTGTLRAVRKGIIEGNPYPVIFLPFAMTLVHRSEETMIDDSPIIHLAHFDVKTWEPADCPLCQAGSKRLKPKLNWNELTKP